MVTSKIIFIGIILIGYSLTADSDTATTTTSSDTTGTTTTTSGDTTGTTTNNSTTTTTDNSGQAVSNCGKASPSAIKDCTSASTGSNSCCFYTLGSGNNGCYLYSTVATSASVKQGNLDLTCIEPVATTTTTNTTDTTVVVKGATGTGCGATDPKKLEDCSKDTLENSSCCWVNLASNNTCIYLGQKYKGSTYYGVNKVECSGSYISLSFVLALLSIFMF